MARWELREILGSIPYKEFLAIHQGLKKLQKWNVANVDNVLKTVDLSIDKLKTRADIKLP